jgi:hypothetical protein
MPKNAILNIKNQSGFDWIFVHHADNILELLLANYNSPEQARALMDLGDLSRLEPNKAIAYHRDLKYPKASCFHLNRSRPKQSLKNERIWAHYDGNGPEINNIDKNIQYFMFDNGWVQIEWLADYSKEL